MCDNVLHCYMRRKKAKNRGKRHILVYDISTNNSVRFTYASRSKGDKNCGFLIELTRIAAQKCFDWTQAMLLHFQL